MRVTGVVPECLAGDDSSENSSESGSFEIIDNSGEIIYRPKRLTCRVSIVCMLCETNGLFRQKRLAKVKSECLTVVGIIKLFWVQVVMYLCLLVKE